MVAEVTEASTVASEKSDLSQKASTPEEATTIPTRTSPIYQNQSIVEKDGRNVDLASRKTEKAGSHDGNDIEKEASKDAEKSSVSRNASETTHANSIKSNDESEDSSASDGNRRRHEEVAAESSGKSTSTKVISEDPLKLAGTNELIVTTTKLAFNDGKKNSENVTLQEFSNHKGISDATVSPSTEGKVIGEKLSANLTKTSESKRMEGQSSAKYEEKRNVTATKQEITTVKSTGEDLSSVYSKSITEDIKFDETKGKAIKDKEIVSKGESRKNQGTISADLKMEDHELESYDRELTTMRGIRYKNFSESKENANDLGTTGSEVLDLEKIDEKEHEEAISLINDTYVNYNHVYRTLSEKDLKASSDNRSIDATESRGTNDLKEEIEVVKNVSQQPTLRILSTANDTAKNDSHLNGLDNQEAAVYIKRQEETGATGNENHHEQNSSVVNTTIESTDGTEERKSIGKPESQVKLPETTTQSIRLEEHVSFIDETAPSPVPQGRTIGFSRVNEFPSVEVKSTEPTEIDERASSVTQTSHNSSGTERMDQKPYPYLKSSRESLQMTTEINPKLENEGVTEETSAYENTIGRGESEKKFVVTEPSVVIENSILQQQKLDKKNINKSANSTTETLSSLIPVTVIPIVSTVVGPTNETFSKKFNNNVSKGEKVRNSGSNDNDVSDVKEAVKATAIRSEGYDVTGNGITEVSSTPDSKEVKSHSGETTESSTLRSTKMSNTSKMIPPNTDIQMEPEEAMMIRSTFVVTESTMVPLDKDVATEANRSTSSMTSAVETSTAAVTTVSENFTESTTKANIILLPPQSSSNLNQTTESTTLNPDELRIPTTTSIELEFVSLTETVSSTHNTIERKDQTIEEHTMPSNTTTIRDMSNNSTDETITTTKSEESTELPMTTEDNTSTTDQVPIVQSNNETVRSRDPPVTQAILEDQGNRTEFTKYPEVTVSVIDLMSVTAGADITGASEDPSETKDSSFDTNVTETSAPGAMELPSNSGVTTNATKSPSVPFAASTVETRDRIPWSTPSTENEETTESIQSLSPDEITLLVKIVIEGTLREVCPRLPDLKQALADVLTKGMDVTK